MQNDKDHHDGSTSIGKGKIILLIIVLAISVFVYYHKTHQAAAQAPATVTQVNPENTPSVLADNPAVEIDDNNSSMTNTNQATKPQNPRFFADFKVINNCPVEKDKNTTQMLNTLLQRAYVDEKYTTKQWQVDDLLTLKALFPRNISQEYWPNVIDRLKLILKYYHLKLNTRLYEPSTIYLIVIRDREEYLQILDQLSFDGKHSQGVYFSSTNLAFVNYKTSQQAQITALHESVHRLNQHFYGYTARWLNEGLAQYLANLLLLNKVDLDFSQLKSDIDPYTLINAYHHQPWQGEEYAQLYPAALKLTAFLLQIEQGERRWQKILDMESVKKCQMLSRDDYSDWVLEDMYNPYLTYDEWESLMATQ
ncbi:hypothetical protein C2869_22025 (plasmid) [Saccharobesus litoralis]|uniref:DUF1570 domain-containing protein n=1 Tax=Saccharobesus litoralis TaxID=2172099 RepID=A0A2S0VYB0_9ALTE|nr:hypothetical protein [Saccharobesus litoralis]AWB69183.1 hypothetical protein C2869_22025 [Saccharobesus litoralis]